MKNKNNKFFRVYKKRKKANAKEALAVEGVNWGNKGVIKELVYAFAPLTII